jgi:NAD(P)H-dependent flavin oxidoreductase YrpB (nitropropane dioxygenase family)
VTAAPMRTRLTELTGIRYPIVQTGMGFVAGARLTAATSKAGGLGIIGSATMSMDALRTLSRRSSRGPTPRSESTCAPTRRTRTSGLS